MQMKQAAKLDNLKHTHLEWLVKSRNANQRSALSLHQLLDIHFDPIKKSSDHSKKAQILVATCFSLWRAAFLADKTGVREVVLQDARVFLGKMLTDNAINYPQDRTSREWTFNYYMHSARANLGLLFKHWPHLEKTLSASKKPTKGTSLSSRRWDRHQAALEAAVKAFREELES